MAWSDDNPFYLLIFASDVEEAYVLIDLGEPGWLTTYADWMRKPGQWCLMRKSGPMPLPSDPAIFMLNVVEGEQPYYTKRHFGKIGTYGYGESIVYGIGKKRLDGHVDRLWILETGAVVPGDDADFFTSRIILARAPIPYSPDEGSVIVIEGPPPDEA